MEAMMDEVSMVFIYLHHTSFLILYYARLFKISHFIVL